jgi:hypothetical protein
MAAYAILDFRTNMNNSGSLHPIVAKFETKLCLSTLQTTLAPKMKYGEFQDGRRPPIEIY